MHTTTPLPPKFYFCTAYEGQGEGWSTFPTSDWSTSLQLLDRRSEIAAIVAQTQEQALFSARNRVLHNKPRWFSLFRAVGVLFQLSVFQSRSGRCVSTVSTIVTVHIQLYIQPRIQMRGNAYIDGREFLLLPWPPLALRSKAFSYSSFNVLWCYCPRHLLSSGKKCFLNAFVNVKKSQTRPERAFLKKLFTISETKQCFCALKLTYLMGGLISSAVFGRIPRKRMGFPLTQLPALEI